jgi:hypothetical protein
VTRTMSPFGVLLKAAIGLAIVCAAAMAQDGIKIEYHGAGWIQGGRIEKASDTLSDGKGQDFNDNWTQNTGGQITAVADLGGGWEGGLGLGAIQSPMFFRGSPEYDKVAGLTWSPYVTEARLTYTVGEPLRPAFQATAGSFHFNYNPDVKNLGLYLLRGMAYPGIVISGFETKDVLPIANIFGLNIRHESGGFRGDFIVNSQTDINPYFDLSFAYVAGYRFLGAIEVGTGVNWYRAVAQRSRITSPGKDCPDGKSNIGVNANDDEICFIKDSSVVAGVTTVDTVLGSLTGVKLMGRFSVDPKALLGLDGPFGPRDLVFYSEAAVLGVKDYAKYYDRIGRRIPVMFGVNLPVFGFLDELSLEAEYYANRNMTDYEKVLEDNSWVPRPRAVNEIRNDSGAVIGTERTDTRSDNWKWSLYGARVVAGHLKLSGQVANDHLRTGGFYLRPTQSETLSDTFDWYWMFKVAYYF